jgi:hypothetical protein
MSAEDRRGRGGMVSSVAIDKKEATVSASIQDFARKHGYLLADPETGEFRSAMGVSADCFGLLFSSKLNNFFVKGVGDLLKTPIARSRRLVAEVYLTNDQVQNIEEFKGCDWGIMVYGRRNIRRMQRFANQLSETYGDKKIGVHLKGEEYRYQSPADLISA